LAESHIRQALELDPSFAQARDWTFRLAARTGNPPPAMAYQHPVASAPTNNYGMASAPAMTPRPGSYGTAPEPASSRYTRPDMAGGSGVTSMGTPYDAGSGAAANPASARNLHPSDPTSPPTPENIGNYRPSTDSELRFLPPVN
jgi:hypothetical protein